MASNLNTKTISEFKTKLSGGGARPNLFEVSLPVLPASITDNTKIEWGATEINDFKFLCKSAQLPGSNIPAINVPFRGRILKVAGDRTFDDWTVTIINDENFKMRTALEAWSNAMGKLDDGTGQVNPSSYMVDAEVRQLGRGKKPGSTDNNKQQGNYNSILRTYKFYDIFPTTIGAIDLSYDSSDTIEEFTVTFAVQYFTIGYKGNDEPNPNQQAIPKTLSPENSTAVAGGTGGGGSPPGP